MVRPPFESIAIRSARRPFGSGISQIANRSCRQNRRVTPRATSAAIGGTSAKQEESGRVAIAATLEPGTKGDQRLAVEDVVADGRDALHPPAGRNIARMEEQGIADTRVLQALVD